MLTPSPAVVRRWVASQLRTQREAAGFTTQAEVAATIGIGRAQLNHFESGRNLPTDDTARLLLELYKADESYIEKFVSTLAHGRSRTRSRAAADDPERFDLYLGLEQGAESISTFDPLTINGLLQHPAYAEAMLQAGRQPLTAAELRRRLRLRMERQAVLDEPHPAQLVSVVAEHVLREPVGGPGVLTAQLDHLLDMMQRPTVDVRVLPHGTGVLPTVHGPFTVLRFPGSDEMTLAYAETLRSSVFYDGPSEVADYLSLMNRLAAAAATAAESMTLIRALREEAK